MNITCNNVLTLNKGICIQNVANIKWRQIQNQVKRENDDDKMPNSSMHSLTGHPAENPGSAWIFCYTCKCLHPSLKSIMIFCLKEVFMCFEMKFETKLFTNTVILCWSWNIIPNKREACKRLIILIRLEEKQCKICENHPKTLPLWMIFGFTKKLTANIVLGWYFIFVHTYAGVSMPTDSPCR